MKKSKIIDRSALLREVDEYVKEYKRLGVLHDNAQAVQKNEIFDQMTDLRNKAMGLLDRAHGRRPTPVKIRFSKKRAV